MAATVSTERVGPTATSDRVIALSPRLPAGAAQVSFPSTMRVAIEVKGAVQGVGFRPFVYRLAVAAGLSGFVCNHSGGVTIEVEGPASKVEPFVDAVRSQAPPLARITDFTTSQRPLRGENTFEIEISAGGTPTALLLPDVATCADCLDDVHRAGDPRFRYPFTNCTNCGPRFSIVHALPYDRHSTTMASFPLCLACAAEYRDPADRRFHAQPTACADCGPSLTLVRWSGTGWQAAEEGVDALDAAAEALRKGQILAAKGLGGFHLMVDATNAEAVNRLRARKGREEKPFAIMVRTVDEAQALVHLSPNEAELLAAPAAPIVLGCARAGSAVASGVAPSNKRLGIMLAATPLHHLLLEAVGRPIVATSGNRSEETLCTENDEAIARLAVPDAPLADLFLLHNRPIARHVDDSVVQWVAGGVQIMRRARGYAPLPVKLVESLAPEGAPAVLAVGGHMKSAIALALGENAFLSQHIGDLESIDTRTRFARVIHDLLGLYEVRPALIAHDMHPDYASTLWAKRVSIFGEGRVSEGTPTFAVQHHHAHLAACLADAGTTGPAIGVIWDGSGYGPDGSVWGGEFLLGNAHAYQRLGHLRPFALPGGAAAVREPWRPALALLHAVGGPEMVEESGCDLAPAQSRAVLSRLLDGDALAATPRTTSAGRLFDGCAALLGLCLRSSYEGHAAMLLEQAADPHERGAYPVPLVSDGGACVLDWEPLLLSLLTDRNAGVPIATIAARVHRGLSEAIGAVAARLAEQSGITQAALSGGCFQNRLLTEWSCAALQKRGLQVLLHRQVPPNDGGLALGQLAVARAHLAH